MKRKLKNLAFFGLLMFSLIYVAAIMWLAGPLFAIIIGGAIWLVNGTLPLNEAGFAALTADRNTHQRSGDQVSLDVAANVRIFAGALVARNASGYATPGAVSTTLRYIGRAAEYVDNTAGANGAKKILIDKGIFKFANYASDLVTIADIGNDCFIVDDQTVAKTNGTSTRSPAGKVFAVDSDGVWVDMRF